MPFVSFIRAALTGIAVAAVLFLPFTALPVMVECNLDTLVRDSTDIITGKVVDKKASWNNEKTTIYTDVTILLDKTIKGDTPKVITVRYTGGAIVKPDGTVVGLGQSDTPSFILNEQVFLFLNKKKDKDTYSVTAEHQGKFSIVQDEETGEMLIKSSAKMLLDPRTQHVRKVKDYTIPLKDMIDKVEKIIAVQKKEK